jgi:hypothetical protein
MATAAAPAPPLRQVTADVLTPVGWMNGIFKVPPQQPFIDFLTLGTLGAQVLKFIRVRVPKEPDPLPFVALSRESLILVAPTVGRELIVAEDGGGFTRSREVACLLGVGVLRGSLDVLANVRLSDDLERRGHLIVLRRCVLAPYGGTLNAPTARSLSTVIVNLSQAIGVSESQ